MGARTRKAARAALGPGTAPVAILCYCLSAQEESPRSAARLLSEQIDWEAIFVCAGHHLVTPALATALSRMGVHDRLTREERDYLDAIRSLHRDRNRMLRRELSRLAAALNGIGIRPLLLKGAISLVDNRYRGAEDRVIGDFDLLIPADAITAAQSAIRALGYTDGDSVGRTLKWDRKRTHHAPPLKHPSLPMAVELHHRLLLDEDDSELLSVDLVTEILILECGASVLLPDPATRLLHNMLHAQISHAQSDTRELDIRQLVEFTAMAELYRDQIDMDVLLKRLRPHRRILLAEYFAKSEQWLGSAYPKSLARSPRERRELWLVELISANARPRRLMRRARSLARMPRRVLDFASRVCRTPGYLPCRLKKILAR